MNTSILVAGKHAAYQKLYNQAAFVHWGFVDRHPFIVDALQVTMFYHFTYGARAVSGLLRRDRHFTGTPGRAIHKQCSHGSSGRLEPIHSEFNPSCKELRPFVLFPLLEEKSAFLGTAFRLNKLRI